MWRRLMDIIDLMMDFRKNGCANHLTNIDKYRY